MKTSIANGILALALIGTLFSGFLTYSKIVLHICAVDPGCPYLMGIPACVYGFGLFLVLLIFAWKNRRSAQLNPQKKWLGLLIIVSGIGVVFATYMSYIDLKYPPCPPGECEYLLLMPSCIYGALFFLAILVLSVISSIKNLASS